MAREAGFVEVLTVIKSRPTAQKKPHERINSKEKET